MKPIVIAHSKLKPLILLALCVAAAIALPAQTLTTIHVFHSVSQGAPSCCGSLLQATNGNLYGTAFGGIGAQNMEGGIIFKINLGKTGLGTTTVLYNFCSTVVGGECIDGQQPYGSLIQGPSGNLFGTTAGGGANGGGPNRIGNGTVYEITPAGNLTTLYSFCSQPNCTDGSWPLAGLVRASNGDFYGTTQYGGTTLGIAPYGAGTIFRITPAGVLTTLHRFCSNVANNVCTDGAMPLGQLIQADDGNLYGTTFAGGANSDGTIFRIGPNGKFERLHSFCAEATCTDGSAPQSGVIQGADGNLYGTTGFGGSSTAGTVYKISLGGAFTSLYSFCSQPNCTDGGDPQNSLIQGTDGDFYGSASSGGEDFGSRSPGTIFKISSNGAFTKVYNFCAIIYCPDGIMPTTALLQDTSGNFYGMTSEHVYMLSVGLAPFVETQTSTGAAGASVKILGSELSGVESVRFNGTNAEFKLNSASEITATVPAGATIGPVQVVTAAGTLVSNTPFTVNQ